MKIVKEKSFSVFLIFIVVLVKYILFNYLEIFHPYGKLNGLISWAIVLPLFILGSYLVVMVLRDNLTTKKSIIDIVLVIPFILFFVYFFLIK